MKFFKLFFLLLAAGLLAGCNDDENPNRFSMNASELSGTYWIEAERCILRNGEWSDDMPGDESVVLYFDAAEELTEYIPRTDGPKYRRSAQFLYDPQTRTLATDMHALGCDALSTVEMTCFTADRMEFRTVSGPEIYRYVFVRCSPTPQELEELAACVDYRLVTAMPLPEPEPLTMTAEQLAGTWWEQTIECTYRYRQGEFVAYRENRFGDENYQPLVGSAGPAYWEFGAGNEFRENIGIAPMLADSDRANSRGFCTYDPQSRTLQIEPTPAHPATRTLTLLRCSAEEIVWSQQTGDDADRTLQIDYFKRIRPTDEELEKLLQYPDYENLTWY